jgi:hypothetical protein
MMGGHLIYIPFVSFTLPFPTRDPAPSLEPSRPSGGQVEVSACRVSSPAAHVALSLNSHTRNSRGKRKTRVSTVSGRKVLTHKTYVQWAPESSHICVLAVRPPGVGRASYVVRLSLTHLPEYPRAARARREPGASQARARCEPGAKKAAASPPIVQRSSPPVRGGE